MSFEYNTNLDSVINALKDFNTTTASPDLSGGLDVRIDSDNIIATDPELQKPRADRLPAIYVRIHRAEEDYEGIGETGANKSMKSKIVEYDVIGIYGKHGGHSPHSELLNDVYFMARNMEGVFQAEYNLSNTALWCNADDTEFSPPLNIGEGFAKAVLITLRAKYFFR